jgi:hypothetical protein
MKLPQSFRKQRKEKEKEVVSKTEKMLRAEVRLPRETLKKLRF